MAEKLKIIPLGGLNEIGKNMTVYEYGGDILVVDCGIAFPGDDMYGIDSIIPMSAIWLRTKVVSRVCLSPTATKITSVRSLTFCVRSICPSTAPASPQA